jgi:Holliday junction resolvase RusA-like endonuclease
MIRIIIPGNPMPKPRGQRSDKWLKPPRPRIAKYREFQDRVKMAAYGKIGPIVDTGSIEAMRVYIAFPASYKEKHKSLLRGKPHQGGTIDIDNVCKGILDTLFPDNDSFIWRIGCLEKRWEDEQGPRVELWVE